MVVRFCGVGAWGREMVWVPASAAHERSDLGGPNIRRRNSSPTIGHRIVELMILLRLAKRTRFLQCKRGRK